MRLCPWIIVLNRNWVNQGICHFIRLSFHNRTELPCLMPSSCPSSCPILKIVINNHNIYPINSFLSYFHMSIFQISSIFAIFSFRFFRPIINLMNISQGQQVAKQIRQNVHKVIHLLLTHGLQYEEALTAAPHPHEFLFPKSKYYRYYTQQLYEHGPTSRERYQLGKKQSVELVKVEGNLESMSVGAMVQIIKNQLAESNREYYQPFDNEYYDQTIELTPKNQNINSKIQQLLEKYSHIIKKKPNKDKEKQKEREKDRKDDKKFDIRKEIGTYHDGSLGAYGGKKYEGLGSRDQFDTFRREKSQSYYQSLQEKSK